MVRKIKENDGYIAPSTEDVSWSYEDKIFIGGDIVHLKSIDISEIMPKVIKMSCNVEVEPMEPRNILVNMEVVSIFTENITSPCKSIKLLYRNHAPSNFDINFFPGQEIKRWDFYESNETNIRMRRGEKQLVFCGGSCDLADHPRNWQQMVCIIEHSYSPKAKYANVREIRKIPNIYESDKRRINGSLVVGSELKDIGVYIIISNRKISARYCAKEYKYDPIKSVIDLTFRIGD